MLDFLCCNESLRRMLLSLLCKQLWDKKLPLHCFWKSSWIQKHIWRSGCSHKHCFKAFSRAMGRYFSIFDKIPKTSSLNFNQTLHPNGSLGNGQLVPFRSVTALCKSPSGSSGWTNFLKILLSLVALWKGQSILSVRNTQPSPKVATFCSERSDIV